MSSDLLVETEADFDYGKRCGEIFLTNQGLPMFHCMPCDNKYDEFNYYWAHIEEDHPLEQCAVEAKEEFLTTEDYQISTDYTNEEYLVEEEVEQLDECDAREEEMPIFANQETEEEENIIIDDIEDLFSESVNILVETPDNNTETVNQNGLNKIIEEDCLKNKVAHLTQSGLKPLTKRHKYKCKQCGSIFTEMGNLRAHIRRHMGVKEYTCTQCPKAFFSGPELRIHLRRHNGERPYLCSECGQSFVNCSALTSHMKRHFNERDYACTECEKAFFSRKELKEHFTMHTQERKYICKTCSASFRRQKTLRAHMKLHENKREYICEIFKIGFNQKPGLSAHMKNKHQYAM